MSATESAAPSLKAIALGDLEHEMANSRTLLERVPGDKLDWKPHPRSFSLGELALHVARLPYWITDTVRNDAFDLATISREPAAASHQELMEAFDRTAAEMWQAVNAASDEELMRPWELRMGDRVLQRMPKIAVVRAFGISHFIHHRGQLTVYLRLLDVPLPPLYGPSADERPNFG